MYESTSSYIAGKELSFTIHLTNGFTVTVTSVDGEPLLHAVKFKVQVTRVDYRDLRLDAMLATSQVAVLTPDELIICLSTVLLFPEDLGLVQAEYHLRHNLHKTL